MGSCSFPIQLVIDCLTHETVASLCEQHVLANQPGIVFEFGMQHDAHEILSLFLRDLASEGLFEEVAVQYQSHCLGNCGVSHTGTSI